MAFKNKKAVKLTVRQVQDAFYEKGIDISVLQAKAIIGDICPYCKKPPVYVDSKEIYGVSHGMMFLCRPCKAYCGVHPNTNIPLGRLANKSLREWRIKAHAAFDPLFKSNYMTRPEAYAWLSFNLKLPIIVTHIGMFGVDTCKKVVELCKKELE